MSYRALEEMRKRNNLDYQIPDTVAIPDLPLTARNYGREALLFIRENCTDLRFDTSDAAHARFKDSDGKSSRPNMIPYNMEKDLDRLSLETAAGRFLSSGTREDAFDIYYCYCEMFKPFGAGYDSTGLLLELLSEHETNASSLLMKHRDHYSHSVYVFLIGLAIYRCLDIFQNAYREKYNLTSETQAAHHFLKYWGLTSLFHDIGYPFEIAHQQMKSYVCALDKESNDANGFAPYVSYKHMDRFTLSRIGDLNEMYTHIITDRLHTYLERIGAEKYIAEDRLRQALKDRAVHENPNEHDYLYMDHAYFSGLMLAKVYLNRHTDIQTPEQLPREVLDSFTAIILHNSLFKFTLRNVLHTSAPLSLSDHQPLCYLLMLCDELQCWDRACYGQNSRGGIFAFDFDMTFPETGGMRWTYYFDKAYRAQVLPAKAYRDMLMKGYTKKSGAVRRGRSKFVDDIDEIISLKDVLPDFEPNVNKPDPSAVITVSLNEEKKKKTGLYLSDSNYLNLYRFALALNGRYCGVETETEMKQAFEENLSLEYKLSNIAQAKGFSEQLQAIGCFYTDRPVDYIPVHDFGSLIKKPGHRKDLDILSEAEHKRWCAEKEGMGWRYGTAHVDAITLENGEKKNDGIMRERTRLHHDLVAFKTLSDEEREKDTRAMNRMLELIREDEGLTIYRMR